jgi:hypothetical protein
VHRGGRQANLPSDFRLRERGVTLHEVEDLTVSLVDDDRNVRFLGHFTRIYLVQWLVN